MATIDILNEFCDATSVVLGTGTANIGSQIDYKVVQAANNPAEGLPLWLVIQVATSIVTGGSAGTLTFQLVSDDTDSISTTTRSIHLQTAPFVTDDDPVIPAGRRLFQCPLPVCKDRVSQSAAGVDVLTGAGAPYERYLGIQAVVAGAAITAGAVDIFLTPKPFSWRAFPDASN